MKIIASAIASLFFMSIGAHAQHKSRIVEEGGTGPHKAKMTEIEGLSAHTVFMPQDLGTFSDTTPLPIVVWGNGACSNSPWEHYKFLNEIASHGFLVIATGYFPDDDTPYKGEMSRPEQQIEAIDWAIAQNSDARSPLFGKLDTRHIAAAGMSCGGLQTLHNCADERISTLMICNSGLFGNPATAMPNMPMPSKDKLKEIHCPIIYIMGGPTDIAYENGMDDFRRIDHVPALIANFPVGHGGTYRDAHGGEFAVPAVAWLKWQLKVDKESAIMFTGNECGLSQRKGWSVEKNSLMDTNNSTQAPSLEFVCELKVTCDKAYTIGKTSHGERVVIPITGGTFEGPKMRGTVIAGGADYQLVDREKKRTELEAIYSISTDDGVNIHIRNIGLLVTAQDGTYFRTAPRFEAPQESQYDWLNNAIFVCVPEDKKGYISLKVWMIK